MSSFSLDFWSFGLSVLDGARSKVVLRVDIDLMEFRQLQEVGIFSYLCYSLAKSHENGWGRFEAWISRVFSLKTLESSGENPHCCGREQCQPKDFTVHVNSDVILGVNFYVVE